MHQWKIFILCLLTLFVLGCASQNQNVRPMSKYKIVGLLEDRGTVLSDDGDDDADETRFCCTIETENGSVDCTAGNDMTCDMCNRICAADADETEPETETPGG